MSTLPIKDLTKTITALEDIKFFRNFAKLSFNRHINAVYHSNSESHTEAKRALLITDKDTQLSIANKQLLFFFSLQKFTQQIEETQYLTAGSVPSDPDMVYVKVQLSPSISYYPSGQSVGKRYIQVPHIDESKLGNLKDFKFTHGAISRLYVFADKKQIKVKAIDEVEGDRAINELLKLVQNKWKLGTSENHSFTGKPPKDIATPKLQGITSKCYELHVYYPNGRPLTFFV